MIKVYIAGHVNEKDYRKYVDDNFSDNLNLLDPLKEIEAGLLKIDLDKYDDLKAIKFEDEDRDKIVELDKVAVESCDIVVAYINKWSCGTIMEVLHAWNHQIPVYVINPNGMFWNDVWLSYHATKFFHDIGDCFRYIINTSESKNE